MVNPLKGRDILTTSDWTKKELDKVLDLAFKFKKMGDNARCLDILKGKSVMLLWFAGSTRTWNSFVLAVQQLGGYIRSREAKDMRLRLGKPKTGSEESLKDTAMVLDRYVDALGIRLMELTPEEVGRTPRWGDAHGVLRKFADYMEAPIINMNDDIAHPTQSMGDIMVMHEKLGGDVRGKKAVLMWAYSPRANQPASGQGHALIAATYGMNVTVIHPEGYDLNSSVMSVAQKECAKNGMKFEISHNPKEALEGADTVYPRIWQTSQYYENGKEEEQRLAARYKDWRLTESLMKITNNAHFMHTMPFCRGFEVDASVADGPNSIIYDQAEDLLYVRKAFLSLLMADEDQLKKI